MDHARKGELSHQGDTGRIYPRPLPLHTAGDRRSSGKHWVNLLQSTGPRGDISGTLVLFRAVFETPEPGTGQTG